MAALNNAIAKNVAQILKQSYVVPLYQRNYNWGVNEITQFLQDIYESFKNNSKQNYYIGSLIVFKREIENIRFEVIDGQQRLTTLHLIAELIDSENIEFSHLRYDSRKEVEAFFDRLSREKGKIKQDDQDLEQSNLLSFFSAVDTILNSKLDGELDSVLSISNLKKTGKLKEFANYFFNNVMLVEVEMPADTDVANYFEIMNNRGGQLQEHEILKAQLMSKIKDNKQRSIFGNVWDACSQMDRPIQKFFTPDQRSLIFGDNYDEIKLKKLYKLEYHKGKVERYSIHDIIHSKVIKSQEAFSLEKEGELDEDIKYTSVIDFTNFLIHVLKLTYYEAEIPLSSDKLLKIYKSIPSAIIDVISPMELLEKIFFYRVIFDRFIVKSSIESEQADRRDGIVKGGADSELNGRWMLVKPVMYLKNTKYKGRRYPTLNFKNTFENEFYQGRILKLLSMLQVTYRQRKNKNYLQFILSLFEISNSKTIGITAIDFLRKVEGFALSQFDKLELREYLEIEDICIDKSVYAQGTNTPHFVFNFIDYLLWVDKVHNKAEHNIDEEFDFTYRNSIEHHYPQALKEHLHTNTILNKDVILNCFGNLCLVSRGANSKLNDREPLGKAADQRFNLSTLTPKRRIMYSVTNNNKSWNEKEIIEHHLISVGILRRRKEILNHN